MPVTFQKTASIDFTQLSASASGSLGSLVGTTMYIAVFCWGKYSPQICRIYLPHELDLLSPNRCMCVGK